MFPYGRRGAVDGVQTLLVADRDRRDVVRVARDVQVARVREEVAHGRGALLARVDNVVSHGDNGGVVAGHERVRDRIAVEDRAQLTDVVTDVLSRVVVPAGQGIVARDILVVHAAHYAELVRPAAGSPDQGKRVVHRAEVATDALLERATCEPRGVDRARLRLFVAELERVVVSTSEGGNCRGVAVYCECVGDLAEDGVAV